MENIRIRGFRAGQIGQWLSCGFRFWRRRPFDNTAPFAVFALAVLVLHAIPVLGDMALLMLLPSVLSSAFLSVHLLSKAAPVPATPLRKRKLPVRDRIMGWVKGLYPEFFSAWSKNENVIPLLLIGFVLVALGLVAHVLFNKVGGQSLVMPYAFSELTGAHQGRYLLAYATGIFFWLLVGMTVMWALPLFVIRDQALSSAVVLSLRAFTRNAGVVVVLMLLLVARLLPGRLLRLTTPVIGLVVFGLGITLATMLLVFAGYCSFRLVFAEDSGPRVPGSHPAQAPRPFSGRS